MRLHILSLALLWCVFFSVPAAASLPYYNADIGYTIWLPKDWTEAPSSFLKEAERTCRPLPMQPDATAWKAGYVIPTANGTTSLLVEVKQGRKMRAADISNFNRFLVRTLHYQSARHDLTSPGRVTLKEAHYFEDKKTLRVETEVLSGETVLNCLTYVVYTRKGMLTFVGYIDPHDDDARAAIDKGVLSLYLDDRIRY